MRMQETVHAVASLCSLAHQPLAVGDQQPQFANGLGRHPDLRNQPRQEESRQMERIARVGLDPGRGDQFDEEGVSHFHLSDEWGQQIVERPGIGGGF